VHDVISRFKCTSQTYFDSLMVFSVLLMYFLVFGTYYDKRSIAIPCYNKEMYMCIEKMRLRYIEKFIYLTNFPRGIN
jgi:hypothetical protein